jgi:hypothetical protein
MSTIINQTELEKLFEVWENDNFHDKETFIRDGIIYPEYWINEPIKILGFFKEAYTKGNGKYDLSKEIYDSAPYRNWWTVARWIYAILEIFKKNEIPEYPSLTWKEGNELLSKIAIVDIKKSNGQTLSNYSNLDIFFEHDKERLKRQIDLINPKIVICGRVFNYYKALYNKDNFTQIQNIDKCYIHQDRLIIDFWHFANRKPNEETYYELCDFIMKARKYMK